MNNLIIVADNVRSIENTGAMFRLADGVGAKELLLVGITPYPDLGQADTRRPWLRIRVTERLQKTGLSGMSVPFKWFEKTEDCISYLKGLNYYIVIVEQTDKSDPYNQAFKNLSAENVAMVVGHEVEGVSKEFIESADLCVDIPMYGKGVSLNVSVAAGIVAYGLKNIC